MAAETQQPAAVVGEGDLAGPGDRTARIAVLPRPQADSDHSQDSHDAAADSSQHAAGHGQAPSASARAGLVLVFAPALCLASQALMPAIRTAWWANVAAAAAAALAVVLTLVIFTLASGVLRRARWGQAVFFAGWLAAAAAGAAAAGLVTTQLAGQSFATFPVVAAALGIAAQIALAGMCAIAVAEQRRTARRLRLEQRRQLRLADDALGRIDGVKRQLAATLNSATAERIRELRARLKYASQQEEPGPGHILDLATQLRGQAESLVNDPIRVVRTDTNSQTAPRTLPVLKSRSARAFCSDALLDAPVALGTAITVLAGLLGAALATWQESGLTRAGAATGAALVTVVIVKMIVSRVDAKRTRRLAHGAGLLAAAAAAGWAWTAAGGADTRATVVAVAFWTLIAGVCASLFAESARSRRTRAELAAGKLPELRREVEQLELREHDLGEYLQSLQDGSLERRVLSASMIIRNSCLRAGGPDNWDPLAQQKCAADAAATLRAVVKV